MIRPVMPDEYEDALALVGHQVDIAHRLRDPHQRGDADANDHERTQGGAENIPADGPHPTTRPRSRQNPAVARAPMPAIPPVNQPPSMVFVIGQQSGLDKAKPLSMHNKTLIGVFR